MNVEFVLTEACTYNVLFCIYYKWMGNKLEYWAIVIWTSGVKTGNLMTLHFLTINILSCYTYKKKSCIIYFQIMCREVPECSINLNV